MGYDFMLLRVEPRPKKFPSPPLQSLDSSVKDIDELPLIFDAVQSAGYRLEGKDEQGAQWFSRLFDDGGSLAVRMQRNCVFIDTHAHWRDVGELYSTALAVAPEVLLFDPQKFLFHDLQSFADFCAASYRELEERGLR